MCVDNVQTKRVWNIAEQFLPVLIVQNDCDAFVLETL